jgi:hypothetical protein
VIDLIVAAEVDSGLSQSRRGESRQEGDQRQGDVFFHLFLQMVEKRIFEPKNEPLSRQVGAVGGSSDQTSLQIRPVRPKLFRNADRDPANVRLSMALRRTKSVKRRRTQKPRQTALCHMTRFALNEARTSPKNSIFFRPWSEHPYVNLVGENIPKQPYSPDCPYLII